VLGIAIGVDVIGVGLMLLIALIVGGGPPSIQTALLALLAGLFSVAGILGLYTGLALGRMGVVAPVTGVIAASLPVAVGIVAEGVPALPVLVGIVAALAAVVLVSRTSDPEGRPSGIEYGLLGGVGLGLFNVVVGALPDDQVAWPLVLIKLGALVSILLIVAIGRRPWRIDRPIVPAVVAVAFLDLAGNGLYLLATQAGRLDVAATLSSLYPVTTIVLAVVILRESESAAHLVGIVMAGVAIVLIAGGSAPPGA
jgi:drug/metabolite transporter (DMT)-like permease